MTETTFVTSMGSFTARLMPEHAPKTVANFVELARGSKGWTDPRDGSHATDPLYAGTIFHRVIDNFMIQGGGFDKNMKQKPTRPPIENEAKNGLKNDLGTIAMARTSAPHSASAQFFVNTKNNDFLNYPGQDGWGYTVFGKVVSGMDVVTKIGKVATGNSGGMGDVPREAVVIESATLVADKK